MSIGPREIADVLLPPFEMALRAGARSVMNSYTDIDGVPTAADVTILTDLLRGTYGFDGTVVSDYFSVAFLETLHALANGSGEAAGLALTAGIDVELPTVNCYGQPLLDAVASGAIDEALVDRAAERVLRQKVELGLLDPGWNPDPSALDAETIALDDAESRALAKRLAERSVVLLVQRRHAAAGQGATRVRRRPSRRREQRDDGLLLVPPARRRAAPRGADGCRRRDGARRPQSSRSAHCRSHPVAR